LLVYHIQRLSHTSGQQEEFGRLIISNPNARDWLHRHLSASFTAGAICQRFFRRPKLWLCTGLITLDKGKYEVTYEGGKGVKITLADPTNTIPVGVNVNVDTTPTSARTLGISQKTIVAAQWMLLYCRNVQRKDSLGTPYFVRLTATYARDNVKGADSALALVSASSRDIARAEEREIELFYYSDDDDDDEDHEEPGAGVQGENESRVELFEPMFPEASSKEHQVFEEALKKIGGE
jgi:hypothetical protein